MHRVEGWVGEAPRMITIEAFLALAESLAYDFEVVWLRLIVKSRLQVDGLRKIFRSSFEMLNPRRARTSISSLIFCRDLCKTADSSDQHKTCILLATPHGRPFRLPQPHNLREFRQRHRRHRAFFLTLPSAYQLSYNHSSILLITQ